MSNCNITIHLGKETRTFTSDAELDEYLNSRASELKRLYKISDVEQFDKVFSLTEAQGAAVGKIDTIAKVYKDTPKKTIRTRQVILAEDKVIKDLDEYDYADYIEKSLSVTKGVETFGNVHDIREPVVTGTNSKRYEAEFRRLRAEEGKSPEEIQEAWERQEFKNRLSAKVGDDIHYIMDIKIQQLSDPSVKLDTSKLVVLTPEDYLKYEHVFNAKLERVKQRYPGAQFYTEFDIVSKSLPTSVRYAVKAQLGKDVDTINGRIDLLVVDTSGKCHIIDWKTSNKHIGRLAENDNSILAKNNWWHSTKKRKAFAQVGWYGAMLEQYGLEVEDMSLECFYVDFGTDDKGMVIKKVTSIEEDFPIANQNGGGTNTASFTTTFRSAARYQFGVTRPITIDKLIKTGEALNAFFPGTNISAELTKRKDADLNHYLDRDKHFWKEVDKSSDEYKEKGYRYFFYPRYLPDEKIKRYFKTFEELKEGVAKYVEELNKSHLTEMSDFAHNLAAVIANGGRDESLKETWLANFTPETKDWLKQRFRKFYENGWDLFINEELNSNGIFLFKKADRIDVVCLTSENLYAPIPITHKSGKKAHNILGATLLDGEQGTDEINTMSSLYANLLYMKVATILANNPGILNGEAKFSSISVINPWRRQIPPAPTRSYLCHNYNNLISKHSNLNLKVLPESMFYDDVDVAISEAGEALLSTDVDWAGELLGADDRQKYYNMEHILRQMKRLRIAYPSEFENVKTRAGFAYYQLRLAILYANGIHPFLELDRGQYFNRGVLPTGLKINQASSSTSINFRNAARTMIPMFRERYTNEFTKVANPFIQLCQEVYKEWGVTETSNLPRKFWENLFVKDGNGNVSKDMILKRPDSSEFKDKPKTRQLIQMFADTLAEARFRNVSDEELDRIRSTDEYWQVPLVPGSMGQYIENSFKEGGIAQVAKGLVQKVRDEADKFQNFYSEHRQWEEEHYKNKDVSREEEVAYNRYIDLSQQQREELIYGKDGKSPNRVWSTDLRWVFLSALERITLTNASRQFGPVFIAYLATLNFAASEGNLDIKELIKAMTDYINNRVFLKDIMDPSLKWWRGTINVIKSVSSKFTLGLSVRNITKEMLTQFYITATRNATGVIPDITSSELWDAFSLVISNAPSSLSKQNFMTFLNQRFAMSNYGMHDRAEFLRKQHWGLLNFNSSDVFITTKIPDDYFRITVLIAKMKHDGCFDAYVEKDGTWVYDITKDKRFTRYLNNDMSNPVEYQKQKQLYEQYLAEWKKTYPEMDWSQTSDRPFPSFPDAYPPSEKAALREMSNELYGAFDGEDKSLLCATFLGSAFMQYKTWLSAKINQWMRAPGFVNIWQRFWNRDENGRRLYFVYATAEDLKNGMDEVRIINEDDPDLDKYLGAGQAAPWIIEEGTYQEGMLQAIGAFAKDLLTWNIDDFKRHWENPITRGQMFNGLMDMFGLLLFAGLIKLMFGEDVVTNKKEQDWLTQWSYGALMGFAADGPIHQVFGGMLGDLNPPSLLALKQWAQTANSVLAGNKSIGQGLIETFGATREMRGYFYAIT